MTQAPISAGRLEEAISFLDHLIVSHTTPQMREEADWAVVKSHIAFLSRPIGGELAHLEALDAAFKENPGGGQSPTWCALVDGLCEEAIPLLRSLYRDNEALRAENERMLSKLEGCDQDQAERLLHCESALRLAREWGIRGRAFDALQCHDLAEWVDNGMRGAPPDRMSALTTPSVE